MPDQQPIEIELTRGPVQYQEAPGTPGGGGECLFFGRTRPENHAEYGPLQSLRYEAYEDMASRMLADLARDAIEQYQALFVRVHHSLGDVPVGSASVLVQVVCPHRKEAFRACRMIIDRLKIEAPIWKCEIWQDGRTWSGADESRRAFHAAQGDER